eukprot:TRINITY_DN5565_c0_g1_i1.p1 TRINITY_DN5565_c0_g1~~TRINITY_DN5565_c0_g1_i1.p1  ORF type:complete len:455 (+),score=118.22 TRINITY_DN5565_c0_g1_i1:104-1468(+)
MRKGITLPNVSDAQSAPANHPAPEPRRAHSLDAKRPASIIHNSPADHTRLNATIGPSSSTTATTTLTKREEAKRLKKAKKKAEHRLKKEKKAEKKQIRSSNRELQQQQRSSKRLSVDKALRRFVVDDACNTQQVVRKFCSAGLNCKSVDASHFLIYQHTTISEEQKGLVEIVEFDFNKNAGDGDTSSNGESSGDVGVGGRESGSERERCVGNDGDDGDDGNDDDEVDIYATTVINLVEKPSSSPYSYAAASKSALSSLSDNNSNTDSNNNMKEKCPAGLTLTSEDFRTFSIDFSAPMFRTIEEWELNLLALERGEWVEGQMKEEAFGRYHKKAKGAAKALFEDAEQRKREKERLIAARERLLASTNGPIAPRPPPDVNRTRTTKDDVYNGRDGPREPVPVVYGRSGPSARGGEGGVQRSASASAVVSGVNNYNSNSNPSALRPSAVMIQNLKSQ